MRKRRAKTPLEDTAIETFRATSPDGRCDAVLVIEDANSLAVYVVRAGGKVEGKRPVVYLLHATPSAGAPIEWVGKHTVRYHGKLDDVAFGDDERVVERTDTTVSFST
ncbi:MAG: hypothetical protein WD716_02280 [Fimbriimonadaceae bacterium]